MIKSLLLEIKNIKFWRPQVPSSNHALCKAKISFYTIAIVTYLYRLEVALFLTADNQSL